MGIEDLSLDLEEHADRVLLITEDAELETKLSALFEKRSYVSSSAKSIAEGHAMCRKRLFDIIVCHTPQDVRDAAATLRALRAAPEVRNTPAIIISPLEGQISEIKGSASVTVLKSPVDPAELLVKMATNLRLQKMLATQSEFRATVSAQNAQLRDLTNRFKRELVEAQTIQRSLLPRKLPEDPGVVFYASYEPLEAVGGDLYDIWKISENRYGVFIGDVTGHGLSAAFIGAMSKMALAFASKESAAIMLQEMNEGICPHMPEGKFVTSAAVIFDSKTRVLQVARGGHPPAYLWRKDSDVIEQIAPDGFAVGFLAGVDFEGYETTLNPGDKLLLVTDGITETTDMDGEMLGLDGLERWFSDVAKTGTIQECIEKILDLQKSYTQGRILKDDNTVLGLECK